MKRIILFFTFLIFCYRSFGQINSSGIPLIRNYGTELILGSSQNWCIEKDKFGNVYFGTQDRGILKYDGTKWSSITIGNNPRIYSLASDKNGIIYVGAAFEFGYIQPDKKGMPEYISLSERIDSISEIRTINSIVVKDSRVNFLGPKFLFQYDIQEDSVRTIRFNEQNSSVAFRLLNINGKLIIADNVEGIYELKDTIILKLPGGDFFRNKICTVLLPYDDDEILIGTFYDGIFLYNYETGDVNSSFIDKNLNERLKVVSIYCGAKTGEDTFVLGTTNTEGLVVFDKSGKLINQITTENSDLLDNTMMAMYCDHNNNSELWLSTYGAISKIYFNIPITSFSEKQGIRYGINEICRFNNDFYLSSDAGVLKSYTDEKSNLAFKSVEGIDTQTFPLQVITSSSGNILLIGSLSGIYQINGNGRISKIDKIRDLPVKNVPSFNVKKIVQSSKNSNMVYFGLEMGGIVILNYDGNYWSFGKQIKNFSGLVSGIVETDDEGFWFLTDDPAALYHYTKNDNIEQYGAEKGVPETDLNSIYFINNNLFVNCSKGILHYEKSTDRFEYNNSITGNFSENKNGLILYKDDEGDIWYSGFDKDIFEVLIRQNEKEMVPYHGVLNLLPEVPSLDIKYFDGKVYFIKTKVINVVDKKMLKHDTTAVSTFFNSIVIGSDSVVMSGSFFKESGKERRIPVPKNISEVVPEFGYDFNRIVFKWTTPNYTEELLTVYSYFLEGFDKEWSKWDGISFGNTMEAIYSMKEYSNLPYGHYNFRVRTRTLTGQNGNELSYEFIILKPWYSTIWAFMAFALTGFLLIFLIIKAYTRKLKNENIRLEGIVAERTAVVVKQKDELESSIHYASRIQMALLPSEATLSKNIRDYFLLFKPRDIVSGDFYWMRKKGERLYIVAADCTGHGVPGAFMSLLGMSFLDEIIEKESAPRADHVLNQLRLHVTESLKQVGNDNEAKDGMDLALLVMDFHANKIEFSGAYNPCFRVRKLTEDEIRTRGNDTEELKDGSMTDGKYLLETIFASKMPIGISSRMNEDFVFYESSMEKGVSYYLFSDGYIDQFGGQDGRKFMKKNFKKLILKIQDFPLEKQKEMLDENLRSWMGNISQIDDILIMGIKTS